MGKGIDGTGGLDCIGKISGEGEEAGLILEELSEFAI